MKQLIILFLAIILIQSCNNFTKEEKDLKKYSLIDVDSVTFQYNSSDVDIIDFNERISSYLGFSSQTNEVLIFDKTGKSIHQFNKQGEGPDQYKRLASIAFYQDTLLAVAAYPNKLVIYNFRGELIHTLNIGNENIFITHNLSNLVFAKTKNNEPLILTHTCQSNLSIVNPEFYFKAKNVLLYNVEKNKFNLSVPYVSTNTYYQQAKKERSYGGTYMPSITINKDNQCLVIYPYDKNIYTYDIDNEMKLAGAYPTMPEYFNDPLTLDYNGYKEMSDEFGEELKKNMVINPRYTGIYTSDDYTFLTYSEGVDPSQYTSNNLIYNSKIESGEITINKYLQFFKNFKKIGHDLKIDTKYWYLSFIKSNNKIFLRKKPTEKDENTFYIAKLVEN